MAKPLHVVIVGGGLFGGCCAYELARAGCRVTLVERDPIGAHASGRNPGNLNPILATPDKLRSFALDSYRLHESLQQELRELGCRDYGVESVRRVLVRFDAQDGDELEKIAAQFTAQPGFAARWLDRNTLHRLDARLNDAIDSGLLLEGNRSLDALNFNLAILEGATKRGIVQRQANVLEIRRRSGGGRLVHTNKGDIECEAVVLATGPWVADTKTWFGIDLPVEPVKGEMLRLRLTDANITHDFTHGIVSLYRRGAREVWVGVTRDSCGFDERPGYEVRRRLIEAASRIMPAIVNAELIEHLASLRPMSKNGLPVLGKIPGNEDVFIANGGGIKGVLTCVGISRAITDIMLTGATNLPISEFTL